MKKIKSYLLIILFGATLGATLTYMRIDWNIVNPPKKTEPPTVPITAPKIEDRIKLVYSTEKDGSIEQQYDIIINNVKKMFTVTYTLATNEENFQVTGWWKGIAVFKYASSLSDSNNPEDIYNSSYIDASFNEYNFKIIPGTDDKNYIAITEKTTDNKKNIYIADENFNIINFDNPFIIIDFSENISLENDAQIWYSDTEAICKDSPNCQIRVRFQENQIFYLMPTIKDNMNFLEERKYTINKNILQFESVNDYKIITN